MALLHRVTRRDCWLASQTGLALNPHLSGVGIAIDTSLPVAQNFSYLFKEQTQNTLKSISPKASPPAEVDPRGAFAKRIQSKNLYQQIVRSGICVQRSGKMIRRKTN